MEITDALSNFESFLKTPEDRDNEKAVFALIQTQKEIIEKQDCMKIKNNQ